TFLTEEQTVSERSEIDFSAERPCCISAKNALNRTARANKREKRAISESSSSRSSLTVSERSEIDFSAERPYCISAENALNRTAASL
ncbi:hypothetical protein, partial [Paenibacillus alginolyticus]|uniref:hypothetical protein n=1 Tax=Paenibacillus alginolyticus TaxID=59839 RepID=UPI002DBD5089